MSQMGGKQTFGEALTSVIQGLSISRVQDMRHAKSKL
jgi:hypothetical protein